MPVVDLAFHRQTEYVRKYLFKAIARKVFYEGIQSFRIMKDGEHIGFLVNDKNRSIPDWYLKAKGHVLEPMDNVLLEWSLNEMLPVTITEDFWTCACDDHWIHHLTQMDCPVCYLKWNEGTNRNTILKGGDYE